MCTWARVPKKTSSIIRPRQKSVSSTDARFSNQRRALFMGRKLDGSDEAAEGLLGIPDGVVIARHFEEPGLIFLFIDRGGDAVQARSIERLGADIIHPEHL